MFADVKSEAYDISESVDKFEKGLNDVPSRKEEELEEEPLTVAEASWLEQFPKRWVIVVLCFSAFLLCNMDRVSLKLLLPKKKSLKL